MYSHILCIMKILPIMKKNNFSVRYNFTIKQSKSPTAVYWPPFFSASFRLHGFSLSLFIIFHPTSPHPKKEVIFIPSAIRSLGTFHSIVTQRQACNFKRKGNKLTYLTNYLVMVTFPSALAVAVARSGSSSQ